MRAGRAGDGAARALGEGGEARVVSSMSDAIVAALDGAVAAGLAHRGRAREGAPPATVRVKVHVSKRQPEGDFVLEGRLLDATREVRARLAAR